MFSLICILPSFDNDRLVFLWGFTSLSPSLCVTPGSLTFHLGSWVSISQPLHLEGTGTTRTLPHLLSLLFSTSCFILLSLYRSASSIPIFTGQNIVPRHHSFQVVLLQCHSHINTSSWVLGLLLSDYC